MGQEDAISVNRISSKQQDEGYSLSQQAKLNKEIALKDRRRIVKEFNIVESAKASEKRDEFNEVIEYLKKHSNIKYAYIEKPDRLTRNLKDIVLTYDLVNNYDKEFVFSRDNFVLSKNSNSHAKFQFDIKAILAKNYIDNLSDEVKKGQRGMLEEGKWPGGSTPTGYKKVNKVLIPDEATVPFVQRTFQLYASGKYSLKTLKNKLDDEGFKSYSGKPLTKSNYHRILNNPIYYGMIPWNNKLYQGSFTPLIDEQLYQQVQAMLKRTKNGEFIPSYAKHVFTYQRTMRCGECNCQITAEKRTKTNKGNGKVHEWIYYRCTHFKDCAQKGVMREDRIENQFINDFVSLHLDTDTTEMLKQKLKENHFFQIQFREKALSDINNRLIQVQSNLDQIYDDKLDGVIDEQTFQRKRAQYLAEQKKLDDQVEKHRIADKKYVDFGCLIFDVAHLASGVFKVRKPDEKRYLLNFVFSNLSLKDGTVQNSLRDIFQAIAEYQKTKNVLPDLDSNQNEWIQSPLSYH